jgi:hypothetical protein
MDVNALEDLLTKKASEVKKEDEEEFEEDDDYGEQLSNALSLLEDAAMVMEGVIKQKYKRNISSTTWKDLTNIVLEINAFMSEETNLHVNDADTPPETESWKTDI